MSDEITQEVIVEKKEPVNLTIETIKKKGGIVDSKPVRKKIVWRQAYQNDDGGIEVDEYDAYVFVRRQSFKVFSKFLKHSDNYDENCVLVAECIAKDETGKENLFTLEQAEDIETSLLSALVVAINEVNVKKK